MSDASNVIHLAPCLDVPATLRRIADQIDAGTYPGQSATLVLDGAIFHMGSASVHNDTAAREAVWNLTYGLHAMMAKVTCG